jgi:hypothetical protein
MSQERLTTGTEVPSGIYRCNACAKQIDCREDECKLPQCSACGSFSWRTTRLQRKKDS